MYFIKSCQIQKLGYLLQFLSNTDKKDEIYTPPEPPAKKQRLTSRARGKRIDAFRIKQKYLSPELVKLIQRSNIDRSVYTTFKNQLLTSGIIKWRYNNNGRNVCAMNDYSINGHLIHLYMFQRRHQEMVHILYGAHAKFIIFSRMLKSDKKQK